VHTQFQWKHFFEHILHTMETSQCCLPGTRRICFPDPKHSGPLPAISPTMLSSTTQHDGLLAACVSTYNTPGILGCTHVKMCAIAYTTTIVWWCLIDNRVFPRQGLVTTKVLHLWMPATKTAGPMCCSAKCHTVTGEGTWIKLQSPAH